MADPYRDPMAPVIDRVDDVLARMTLEEKVAQLGGVWITDLVGPDGFDEARAGRHLEHGIGHVTRIGASTGLRPTESAAVMNAVQRHAIEQTRLGIPVVVHEESTGGYCARDATVFPQAIGLAATWDPGLVEEVAVVIREQLMAVGARHTLAPVLDIARDPRWGRVEETYGENPVLAGAIGTAYVKGLQTDDLRNGVICTGKHFLGYGLPEGGMNHAPVHLGPRELREVFAEPFAAAIRDAGLASIMNSYSCVDGLPCAGAPEILTELLRDELGFEGLVVADYFAVALLITHHRTAADRADAAAQALAAGLDLELPAFDCYRELTRLVESGALDVALVDRSVRRVLESKFRLGLFDNPFVDADGAGAKFDTFSQRDLARRAAARSVVLLRNDNALLPLDLERIERVAVIGPLADSVRGLQGDYHYPAHAEIVYESQTASPAALPQAGGAFAPGPHYTPHVTPLAALTTAIGDWAEVDHEPGCEVTGEDRSRIDAAVLAAERADVALLFVGGESGLMPHSTVGEARDASELGLTGVQQELVERVVGTGVPSVVTVIGGRVFALPWIAEHAAALLFAWVPGEEGGTAIADVLLGVVNPSGRLPVSLPRHVGQVPVHATHLAGGGRSQFWHEYTDGPANALFAFGHGLSYTTFSYSDVDVIRGSTTTPTVVEARITNAGARAGDEVVQLYVTDEVASAVRPFRALVGFARVPLAPGESKSVRFTVDPTRLAFYDPGMRFVCEPGAFTFAMGPSWSDIRLRATVDLVGDVAEHRQREVVSTTVVVD
ncbi:MAG TPA: glycoside hydrolase family 3 N-terminal domain-containing protein [Acidimicrobiales bacterium]|jgi:beta-glucosidase|nr:glycoside hydrolase family 3 N-terminal domain-containing protein [Acidimicrobiales bacterium]